MAAAAAADLVDRSTRRETAQVDNRLSHVQGLRTGDCLNLLLLFSPEIHHNSIIEFNFRIFNHFAAST